MLRCVTRALVRHHSTKKAIADRVEVPHASLMSEHYKSVKQLKIETEVTTIYNLCARAILGAESLETCETQFTFQPSVEPVRNEIIKQVRTQFRKKGYRLVFDTCEWYSVIRIRAK
jgi:hypothetical protein